MAIDNNVARKMLEVINDTHPMRNLDDSWSIVGTFHHIGVKYSFIMNTDGNGTVRNISTPNYANVSFECEMTNGVYHIKGCESFTTSVNVIGIAAGLLCIKPFYHGDHIHKLSIPDNELQEYIDTGFKVYNRYVDLETDYWKLNSDNNT